MLPQLREESGKRTRVRARELERSIERQLDIEKQKLKSSRVTEGESPSVFFPLNSRVNRMDAKEALRFLRRPATAKFGKKRRRCAAAPRMRFADVYCRD